MPNPYDQFVNPYDQFDQTAAAAPPKPKRSNPAVRVARDIGATALGGAVRVPETLVGLADIPTGGRVGKFLENQGGAIGFRPQEARQVIEGFYSPETQAARQRVGEAEGFVPTVKALVQNPSALATMTGEQVPTMLAGGVIGRGVKTATGIGDALATGIGEGVVTAGQNVEQVRQESPTGLLTPKQVALNALAGGITGGISAGGARLAQGLGIADPQLLATRGLQAAQAPTKSLPRRMIEGGLSEGVLQELPQSAQEQILQNISQGKPWDEGVGSAAAQGMVMGGVLGAGAQPFERAPRRIEEPPAAAEPEMPEGPPPQLPYAPQAGAPVVYPDGSVSLGTEGVPPPPAGPLEKTVARGIDSGIIPPNLSPSPLVGAQNVAGAQGTGESKAAVEARSVGARQGNAPQPAGVPGVAGAPAEAAAAGPAPEVLRGQGSDNALTYDPNQPVKFGRWIKTRDKLEAYAASVQQRFDSLPEGKAKERERSILERIAAARAEADERTRLAAQPTVQPVQEAGVQDAALPVQQAAPAAGPQPTEPATRVAEAAPQPQPSEVPAGPVAGTNRPERPEVSANRPDGEVPSGVSNEPVEAVSRVPEGAPAVAEAGPAGAATARPEQAAGGAPAPAAAAPVAPEQPPELVNRPEQAAGEVTPITAAANEAATSPTNNLPEPTDAQKDAGNYKKGKVVIDGMNVSIENPKGSIRRSKEDAAKPWQVEMPAHYGYIRGTVGADTPTKGQPEQVDLMIGPKEENHRYWIVNQNDEKGNFDEHKVITGVESQQEAVDLYKSSFSENYGDKLFRSASHELTPEQLKAALPAMGEKRAILGGKRPSLIDPRIKESIDAQARGEPGPWTDTEFGPRIDKMLTELQAAGDTEGERTMRAAFTGDAIAGRLTEQGTTFREDAVRKMLANKGQRQPVNWTPDTTDALIARAPEMGALPRQIMDAVAAKRNEIGPKLAALGYTHEFEVQGNAPREAQDLAQQLRDAWGAVQLLAPARYRIAKGYKNANAERLAEFEDSASKTLGINTRDFPEIDTRYAITSGGLREGSKVPETAPGVPPVLPPLKNPTLRDYLPTLAEELGPSSGQKRQTLPKGSWLAIMASMNPQGVPPSELNPKEKQLFEQLFTGGTLYRTPEGNYKATQWTANAFQRAQRRLGLAGPRPAPTEPQAGPQGAPKGMTLRERIAARQPSGALAAPRTKEEKQARLKTLREQALARKAAAGSINEFVQSIEQPEAGKAQAALARTVNWTGGVRGAIGDLIKAEFDKGARVVLTKEGPAFVHKDMKGWSKKDIGSYGMQYANWLQSQEAEPKAKLIRQPKKQPHPPFVRGSRALAAISKQISGISPSLLSDLSERRERVSTRKKSGKVTRTYVWDNPMVSGVGPLFRKGGSADITEIARVLEEDGYIPAGTMERDPIEGGRLAAEIIKTELRKGGTTLQVADTSAIEEEWDRRREEAMGDQYPELDPEAAAEAEAERLAIMEENDAPADIRQVDAEDIPFDYTPAGAQGAVPAVAEQPAPGTGAPAAEAGSAEGEQAGLTLEQPTPQTLRERAEQRKSAQAAEQTQQKQLEQKAQADAERAGFTLTGSNRPADIARAAGQRELGDEDLPDFQRQTEKPVWTSALSNQLDASPIKQATRDGWKQWVTSMVNKGLVKRDEIEWSGLPEWLDTRARLIATNGKLTKEDVQSFLYHNGVRVQETMLGGSNLPKGWTLEQHPNGSWTMRGFGVTGSGYSPMDAVSDAIYGLENVAKEWQRNRNKAMADNYFTHAETLGLWQEEFAGVGPGPAAKYAQWQLPGGKNYREILLQLPLINKQVGWRYTKADGTGFSTHMGDTPAERAERERANEAVAEPIYEANPDFESRHWNQPNVIAHIRINDRTDADGKKVLFVEEIQSDWAQKGRKEGFRSPKDEKRYGELKVEHDALARDRDPVTNQMRNETRWHRVVDEMNAISDRARYGIAAAPFVGKTDQWTALALKRIIKLATEEGYDRVAFINGTQSADRYNLRHHISQIKVQPIRMAGDRVGEASGWRVTAKAAEGGANLITQDVTDLKKIDDYIGKEAGDRAREQIAENGDALLEGLDLDIGGEGMKAFYDKIVPATLKDVLKKVGGGEVKTLDVSAAKHRYHVTREDDGYYVVRDEAGEAWADFQTEHWANAEAEELNKKYAASVKGQLGFEITDKMREIAGEGLPMFARRDRVGFGRIRRTVGELASAAQSVAQWKDWYVRHIEVLRTHFGDDAELFGNLLAATSQRNAVGSNVTAALKAYRQYLRGEPFTGFMRDVRLNLERATRGEPLSGPKISEFQRANAGDEEAMAIDRHVSRLLFNRDTPTKSQIDSAKRRIRLVSRELDWTPREVQAAFWAYNQVREGADPNRVQSYDTLIEQKAKEIADLRAANAGREGRGVRPAGRTAAPAAAAQAGAPETGAEAAANIGMLERGLARVGPGTADATTVHPYVARRLPGGPALRSIAEALGQRIQGFDLNPALKAEDAKRFGFFNGAYLRGVTYLRDTGLDRPHLAVLGHELSHRMAKEAPEVYKRFSDAVMPYVIKSKYGEFAKSAVAREHTDEGKVREEFMGEILADGFMDKGFWNAVGQKSPVLLRRVVTMVRNLIDTILRSVGYTPQTEKYLTDYRKVLDIAAGAVAEYQRANTGALGAVEAPDFQRKGLPEFIASGSAALQSAASKINTFAPEKTIREKFDSMRSGWLDRLVQGMIDAYRPLKNLSIDAYIQARMVKAADGALEGTLLYGKPVLNDDGGVSGVLDGKGFLGLMQRLNGEHDRFFMWVAGNRSNRLLAEGRENLFEPAEIRAMMNLDRGRMRDGADRAALYADVQKELAKFNKAVLDFAEKAGLVNSEDRKNWEHYFYAPFFRVDDDQSIEGPVAKVRGIVNQKGIFRLKGGKDNLGDLMHNTMLNWSHLLSASMANVAAEKAIEASVAHGIATQLSERDARKLADQAGGGAQPVYFLSNGQKRWFMVTDPAVLSAITSLEAVGLKGPAMKLMQKAKYWLTLGATISPAFKIRNLLRDTLAAPGVNDMSYNILTNVMSGWKGTKKVSPHYQQMIFSGAAIRFGTLIEGNRGEHAKHLIEAGIKDDTILDTPEKIKAAMTKWYDKWQEFGDRMENVNRSALYDQLRKAGMSPRDAAFQARDFLDFSLNGSFQTMRILTQVIPFLNARVQGLYKLGRAYKHDRQRLATMTGAVMVASVALLIAFEDDDDWKKREDWDRDFYWWFKIPGMDIAYRIPKPFEIGALGTLAERSMELLLSQMRGDNEMNASRFIERMKQMFMSTFAFNPVPQLFKPMVDLYANQDSFTGRDIETFAMQGRSKSERYGPNTTQLAKLLGMAGDVTGVSAAQIDFVINAYFGWLGTISAGVIDEAVKPALSVPAPGKRWDDWAMRFAKELPETQSRYTTAFYQSAREAQQLLADVRLAREERDIEKIQSLMAKPEMRTAKMFQQQQRRFTEITKQMRVIRASDMESGPKREALDELNHKRNTLARAVMESAQRAQAAARE